LKKGCAGRPTDAPDQPGAFLSPQQADKMILFVDVKLNQIFSQGRNFNWVKPDSCPRCQSRCLWGHGFAACFFDGYSQALMLRRYRCPDCGCIIRMRPIGYFARFQAAIAAIRSCLQARLSAGKWPKGPSTSRQRHWMSALKRKSQAFFGIGMDLMNAFDWFIKTKRIPVSRSI